MNSDQNYFREKNRLRDMLQELDHAERYGPMREVPVLKQKYEAQKKVVDALSKKTN